MTERIIYVARHGETAWNRDGRWQGHTDIVLNEAGREQARALAAALEGLGIVAVRSSDLARARETAEIVAARLGIPRVDLDLRLRERRFGCFEGLTRRECEERFPEAWASYRADPRVVPPGAEPQDELIARMRAATLSPGPAPALIVGHGGAIRALIASIAGSAPPPLENGALFRLEVSGDAFGPVARVR